MLTKLYAAPGNPGIARHAELVVPDLEDHQQVVEFCHAHAIDLVVVGPEGPLVDGIVDSLTAARIAAFGPTKAAARLEGSKSFTKALCDECNIPTAAYAHCRSLADAQLALGKFGLPVVVKADGLAAGKGVVVASTRDEADAALISLFQVPGAEVVIEECLNGEEVSLFALSDGREVMIFATAQDHKRIGEGDTGPNTGGMGAYSPATILTPALERRAMDEIIRPTVAAMHARGTPFVGVLFAGLMLTSSGPKLIEYNVRFGDPETQAILPRYQGDLALLLASVARGDWDPASPAAFDPRTSLTVVMATPGYPGTPVLGQRVVLPEGRQKDAEIFVAGLKSDSEGMITAGGRVLAVTGLGDDIAAAQAAAYATTASIDFASGYFRRDIGWREIDRLNAGPS